jgi:hypothetical protein
MKAALGALAGAICVFVIALQGFVAPAAPAPPAAIKLTGSRTASPSPSPSRSPSVDRVEHEVEDADLNDDNSGPGSTDSGSDDNSGPGSGGSGSDDNSGPGSGGSGSDDNSGPGSGGSGSDDNSGPG